jgi:hypothetical protein
MTATTVPFTKRSKVVKARLRTPRIGTDGDLGAEVRPAHSDAINGFGKQVVRDELVVAFHVVIFTDIEINGVVGIARVAANDVDRLEVTLIERPE